MNSKSQGIHQILKKHQENPTVTGNHSNDFSAVNDFTNLVNFVNIWPLHLRLILCTSLILTVDIYFVCARVGAMNIFVFEVTSTAFVHFIQEYFSTDTTTTPVN